MNDKQNRHLISYPIFAIFPLMVIAMLFFLPSLFQNETALEQLDFVIEKQNNTDASIQLTGSFRQEIAKEKTVWLYAENAEITVNTKGKQFTFNERGNTPSMFRSPGSQWYSFHSPEIKAGEPVVIEIKSYYGEPARTAESLLCRLYAGEGGLLPLLLKQINFISVVVFCAIVAGMIYLVEGMVYAMLGMTDGVRIALFGLYLFTGGLWCMTDMLYPYLTLLISPPWAASIMDVLGLLLFPIALALMMCYYIRERKTRLVMYGVFFVEIITAVVCLLFQLAGKADLMEQQLLIGVVAILNIGIAMACTIIELLCYRNDYLLLLFLSVLPVFISEILDGINILLPFMPRRVLMSYSFVMSIFLLILQFVSYAKTELTKEQALRKARRELENSRISIMISQIQPHFLYNALQGIKEFCDDNNPVQASEALEHFSYYLRGNLDSLVDMGLVSFDKELTHIKDYLYLEKMRFPQKLNIQMDLSVTDFLLPPLTIQPLIENAIRHGIVKKKGGGTLTVQTKQMDDAVIITVMDNGVGFDLVQKKTDGRSHIGIENTRSRLQALCGGTLLLESEIGIGTTAKIILPRTEVTQ